MDSPAQPGTSVERRGTTVVVHVHGDVVVPTVEQLDTALRTLGGERDVRQVVVDLGGAGRLDSSGVAVLELARRALQRSGKELALEHLEPRHRAAFELAPPPQPPAAPEQPVTWLEGVGAGTLAVAASVRALGALVLDTVRLSAAIAVRRKRIPAGSVGAHVLAMGADALFIVGLLSFLLGMTIGFQGAVQLQRFGAGPFVSDMVGVSMVREFSPLITAIVLTGRTGAAIAAELGTMRVGSEIDALTAMGVNPVRFLVVPRIVALTFVQPALTLMSMFIGIAGGMLVASLLLDMSPSSFWLRIIERVTIGDFTHGIGKSFVFAWIIGFAGSHLGLHTRGGAASVGIATTRTVVVSVFSIVVVDAAFATLSTFVRYS